MKKIAIISSLLALTACGGGSGSGGVGVPGLTAEESNARVTGMNSFVVIGGANPTINPNARAAVTGILQSDGGMRYDLENVTFKSIPTSGVIADLVFHTNSSGKITSIEFPDALAIMEEYEDSLVPAGEMKRQGDSNRFIWKTEEADVPFDYLSYAREVGLKYSDFGVLKIDLSSLEPETGELLMPFAGGYDKKNVNNDRMEELANEGNIVFTGIAKGQVTYNNTTTTGDVPLDGGLTDYNATLTFLGNGSQKLSADFSNWAKIEAVKMADGTNQFVVHEMYLDNESPYYLETSPSGLIDGEMSEHSMTFQTGYYGDNDNPSEAVGLVQYQYMSDFNPIEEDYENHINVDLGFGGTRN